MRSKTQKRGFTLIEMMTVIAIIVILTAILMPAIGRARERAYVNRARAAIATLEMAFSMYETDFGTYPPTDTDTVDANVVDLLTDFATFSPFARWQGPYIDFKQEDLENGAFVDPWGDVYNYESRAVGAMPPIWIWSNGPNGNDDTRGEDDISNL